MERPERPSRPEKGLRSGGHPYRERHRIVSSDSESDMEVDLSAPVRIQTMRLQRPSRPSVEALSALPLHNSNSVVGTSSSFSSSDPYHLPSPLRLRAEIRDTDNTDTQAYYPFMLKDDNSHRSPALFYRKRPGPPHFVSPLSDVLERRSNSRNCKRLRFPSPHTTSASSNWEAKRFCPGPAADPLVPVPEQKMQHRPVTATLSSCLMEPHSSTTANERADRDESRVRAHTNNCSWPSGAGPSDTTAHGSLLQFFEENENNTLRNIGNEETENGNNILIETNTRSAHTEIGTLDLSCPPPSSIVPPPLHPAAVVATRDGSQSGGIGNISNINNTANNNSGNNSNDPVPCSSVEPIMNNDSQYDNTIADNNSNILILSDPVSYELRESISSRLRRYRNAAGHSSSLQSDNNSSDHPSRASSHILRALDELRFTPMRDPWLHIEHVDHSVEPGLGLPANRPSITSNTFTGNSPLEQSHPVLRRRMDYNIVDSDNDCDEDSEELIERVTVGPDPVQVEDISDLENEYDTAIEGTQDTRNRQAVLTHPIDVNVSGGSDEPNINNNSDSNITGNGQNDHLPTTLSNGQRDSNRDINGMECENNENDRSVSTSNSAVGNSDDVIILTLSPSPRRQQHQESSMHTTPLQEADLTADATAAMAVASISVTPPIQSSGHTSNASSSFVVEEGTGNTARLDCDEFNSKLVSLLECPVCMETIVPPIQQCRKGHPVCQVCRPKLSVCPTCRARFSENRNLLMEKVAEMMLFPCKNVHMGCSVKVQLKDKKKHELSCGFRQYDCIVSSCGWKGFKQELVVHVSSVHKSQVIVGNNQKIRVPLQANVQTTWVLSAMDEVFIVTFINKDRFLSGCTVYLGNYENAKNYFYEFTVSSKDMCFQWKGKTFADQGQVPCSIAPFDLIVNKGFSLSVNHSIIEERDPRLLNKIDVTVSVFKSGDSTSCSPLFNSN